MEIPIRGRALTKLSFLTVNYNMAGVIEKCVSHFESLCPEKYGDFEFLIADNSTDPAFRVPADFETHHPQARVFALAPGVPLGEALNILLEAANGDFISMMHPDIELAPDTIDLLLGFFDENPKAGILSPNWYWPSGEIHALCIEGCTLSREFFTTVNAFLRPLIHRNVFHGYRNWDRASDVKADFVYSMMLMTRKETLRDAGPIDSVLRAYYTNADFCDRATLKGWTCHYVLSARAVHFERWTPAEQYLEMAYKTDDSFSHFLMRTDQINFLACRHSMAVLTLFRILITFQDVPLLLSLMRKPIARKAHIKAVMVGILALWRPAVR